MLRKVHAALLKEQNAETTKMPNRRVNKQIMCIGKYFLSMKTNQS
jgi:hypothetical protein